MMQIKIREKVKQSHREKDSHRTQDSHRMQDCHRMRKSQGSNLAEKTITQTGTMSQNADSQNARISKTRIS